MELLLKIIIKSVKQNAPGNIFKCKSRRYFTGEDNMKVGSLVVIFHFLHLLLAAADDGQACRRCIDRYQGKKFYKMYA